MVSVCQVYVKCMLTIWHILYVNYMVSICQVYGKYMVSCYTVFSVFSLKYNRELLFDLKKVEILFRKTMHNEVNILLKKSIKKNDSNDKKMWFILYFFLYYYIHIFQKTFNKIIKKCNAKKVKTDSLVIDN